MKKIVLTMIILTGLSLSTFAGVRQHKPKNGRSHAMKELNLSDEQKGKMQALRSDLRIQQEALDKELLTKDDRITKNKQLGKDYRAKVKDVLTPEQQNKLAKKQELRKRGERNHSFAGKNMKKGMKDNFSPEEKEKLKGLKDEFVKGKKTIELSRIAPEEQVKRKTELTKKYREDVREIKRNARKKNIDNI